MVVGFDLFVNGLVNVDEFVVTFIDGFLVDRLLDDGFLVEGVHSDVDTGADVGVSVV